MIDPTSAAVLLDEAVACHARAQDHRVDRPLDEDRVGRGQPGRWLESTTGGAALESFYQAQWLRDRLRDLTGLDWRPSGANATYSYYRRAGHQLDLHRDVDECDLAVITCLHRVGVALPRLVLYPERGHESLSSIRATPDVGALEVDLAVGESLIFLGGFVAHRLPALAPGQLRIISPMCFSCG